MNPMQVSKLFVLVCVPLLLGCVADVEPKHGDGSRQPAVPDLNYAGPQVQCKIDRSKLAVAIKVHSGGFALDLLRTATVDGHVRVEVRLTSPAEGEVVVTAEQTMELAVDLPEGSDPVWVYVRQAQRGAQYLVPPELTLAAVIPR